MLKLDKSAPHAFDRDRFREIFVELSPALQFRMLELRHPDRGAHWSQLWPTSIALSQWLLTQPPAWFPASAIELGCGLGLVSLTLAHLNVVVEGTDREPDALLLTEDAAEFHSLRGLTTGSLDWSSGPSPATALLVGSDLMYEQSSPELMFSLIHKFGLLAHHGALVLGTPRRRQTYMNLLVNQLVQVGYGHSVTTIGIPWQGTTEVIVIHCLSSPGGCLAAI